MGNKQRHVVEDYEQDFYDDARVQQDRIGLRGLFLMIAVSYSIFGLAVTALVYWLL